MWIVAAVVLSATVAGYLLLPYFAEVEGSMAEPGVKHRQDLIDKKERSLRALKDLELDFAMGKISSEDFDVARTSLASEASKILQELKYDLTR